MTDFLIIALLFGIVVFTGFIPRLVARINGRPVHIKTKSFIATAYLPYRRKRKNMKKQDR